MDQPNLSRAELLELLVAQLTELAIVLRDPAGRFVTWNQAIFALFGYTREEFLGQTLALLYPAGSVESVAERISTDWMLRKDGERILIEIARVPLKPEDGKDSGSGLVLRDVTASRREMQHELEAANRRFDRIAGELERSNQELEEFARIASHDLSAPITTTRWLTDLLITRHAAQLDSEGMKCARQISSSLERMANLTDAVLSHALVGKKAISSVEATDTTAALNAAIENLRGDIQACGAVIEKHDLPRVLIQPLALTQLFQNLLSNALKYGRPGVPPHIVVSAERQDQFWVLAVRDNGIGIESSWFERIFLPLQRQHGITAKGSGIGLATCKKIAMRAGGEIWVESEVGKGSAFYCSLPATESVD